jgi:hypothetical protein
MTDFGKFLLLAVAGIGTVLLLISFPLFYYFDRQTAMAIVAGSLVGLLNIIIAYRFNKKAFLAENIKVMRVFLSGMALRFLVILIFFVIVAKFSDLNLLAFALAVVGFYLILQIYEVKYLSAQLAKKKKR